MNNTLATFKPELYYHVYNRTNNKEDLFSDDEDKFYFISLTKQYLQIVLDVFAYSILDNHFHLCIKIKNEKVIRNSLIKIHPKNRTSIMKLFLDSDFNQESLHCLVSHQFSRMFNCYTKSINKKNNRKGNLFNRPFKRSQIDLEFAFKLKIYYLHHNARHHGIVDDFMSHEWNSYNEIWINEKSIIDTDKVIKLFGGRDNFQEFHNQKLLPTD
ncbi:MAG: hypothetical protein HKO66_01885 [Saprospiraceae bacterium]|nr:transposase [Bacteroidia bacterium]NNE14126.1 hypothetical protein [Saprospiraceae bacterium]NNL90961.1 hypothetical protein [Saprospiraceae bacterium]